MQNILTSIRMEVYTHPALWEVIFFPTVCETIYHSYLNAILVRIARKRRYLHSVVNKY